jgi:hypothetical protein
VGIFFAGDFFPAFIPATLAFETGMLFSFFDTGFFFAGAAFFTGTAFFDRAEDMAGLRTFCTALVPEDPETFLVPGICVLRTGWSRLFRSTRQSPALTDDGS